MHNASPGSIVSQGGEIKWPLETATFKDLKKWPCPGKLRASEREQTSTLWPVEGMRSNGRKTDLGSKVLKLGSAPSLLCDFMKLIALSEL